MTVTRPLISGHDRGDTFSTSIYTGRKNEAPYTALAPSEEIAVHTCLDMGFEHLAMVSPKLASIYQAQRADIITWAGFAKAAMGNKVIGYPSQPGGIGVCWLNPQSIYYTDADDTANNGWDTNTNNLKEIDTLEETYLFGSSSEYYKSYDEKPNRAMSVILKDGLVEVGTTPSFMLHQIRSESDTQYGVISESPLHMLPIEEGLGVYLHKTIGMVPLWSDLGIKWSVLPIRTGTPTVIPIGVTFYEHGYLNTLGLRSTS